MTRVRSCSGYIAIALVCLGLAVSLHVLGQRQYDVAKANYVELARVHSANETARIREKLQSIYENIRTLTLLPSIQEIERHGSNLGEDDRTTIQQIYNNLANNVSVSEVYILPADFDPEKTDPTTNKPEEPILMFDELIVNASSRSRQNKGLRGGIFYNMPGPGEVEIHEYRQLRRDIAYLKAHYPTNANIEGLAVPIISGPEVITCDNTKYTDTGNDADRSGVMFSVPFFTKSGTFKGMVTAIILSNALRDILPERNFALVNNGYNYVAASHHTGQQSISAQWVSQNTADPNLLYSEVIPLPFHDMRSAWTVWTGLPDSNFHTSAEVKSIHAIQSILYVVIAILMLASMAWWWLITRSIKIAALARSELEHRVVERTQEINFLATHDVLTGLPNRALLCEQMEATLSGTRDHDICALLFVDLDKFKTVNDTLGHAIGDKLLKAMAGRLVSCTREGDIVARLGGDEFIVFQRNITDFHDPGKLAQRIIELACQPFEFGGQKIVVGASIGISTAPQDAQSAEILLENADLALYRAKGDGRGVFVHFEPAMNAQLQARRLLEQEIKRALIESEFVLHYQPQVSAETGKITGFEALVRWNHPTRGLVPPAEFIPMAEEIGLIVPLGEWIVRTACMDAAKWPTNLRVSVNLSAVQFNKQSLGLMVVSALQSVGLAPHRLELEITESVLVADTETTLAILHQLRSLGVRIAMDDFGTGHSSLSYLRSFPFDKIKIDRSFIAEMGNSPDCLAIVKAIAGLGSSLGMSTTAEGVETQEQLHLVTQYGCTDIQGYYYGSAKPADHVAALLQAEASGSRMKG